MLSIKGKESLKCKKRKSQRVWKMHGNFFQNVCYLFVNFLTEKKTRLKMKVSLFLTWSNIKTENKNNFWNFFLKIDFANSSEAIAGTINDAGTFIASSAWKVLAAFPDKLLKPTLVLSWSVTLVARQLNVYMTVFYSL